MARHPHEIMGSDFIAELKRTLPLAEKQLEQAQEQYDLAVRAGIANAEMAKRLEEARRRVAQMRAAFLV